MTYSVSLVSDYDYADVDTDSEAKKLGRELHFAVEALGEALCVVNGLPPVFLATARALAAGRSRVPFDGESGDFSARVIAAVSTEDDPGPSLRVDTLRAWLGSSIVEWLSAGFVERPPALYALGLRGPLEECISAREAVRALELSRANAVADWYSAGAGATEESFYRAASLIALDEAVDRWCALGCDGDLGKYVSTWQHSAAGWAERALGHSIDVGVTDVGNLRAIAEILKEFRVRRVPRKQIPIRVAERLGISRDDAERLLAATAEVEARRDPSAVLKRRWSVIKPIAECVSMLARELGRDPTITEVAAKLEIHPVLVELVVDALEG